MTLANSHSNERKHSAVSAAGNSDSDSDSDMDNTTNHESAPLDCRGRRPSEQMYKNMIAVPIDDLNLGIKDKDKKSTGGSNGNIAIICEHPECSKPEKANKVAKGWKRFLGLALGLSASVAFSLAMLTVKLLSNYDPSTVGVWRFAGIFAPSLPIVLYYRFIKGQNVFSQIWPLTERPQLKMAVALFFRGTLGCTAIVLQYYAIQYIELADSTVIAFSTPVFVSFVARIFLGEKIGIVPIIVAVLTMFGVVVIARPPLLTGAEEFSEDNLFGVFLAFTSMIFATLVFVILRYLREVHFALVTTTFGFIGIVQCAAMCVIMSTFDLPHTPFEWFLAVCLAGLTFIGQSLMTTAFKFEDAGPVALTRTFDVIFAFIWQAIFLGVYPDIFSLLGSIIVIFGVVLIGLRKGLSSLPEDSPSRQRFWFLLK